MPYVLFLSLFRFLFLFLFSIHFILSILFSTTPELPQKVEVCDRIVVSSDEVSIRWLGFGWARRLAGLPAALNLGGGCCLDDCNLADYDWLNVVWLNMA